MKKSRTSKYQFAGKRAKEQRFFSEAARKAIIAEVDDGLSIAEAARKYEVSQRSICTWRLKYSATYLAPIRKVVEHQSDSQQNKLLQAELAEVYQLLGQTQAKNVLLEKVIELANQEYSTDLKKTFVSQPSSIILSKQKKGA